jgi:hypothetical protein
MKEKDRIFKRIMELWEERIKKAQEADIRARSNFIPELR